MMIKELTKLKGVLDSVDVDLLPQPKKVAAGPHTSLSFHRTMSSDAIMLPRDKHLLEKDSIGNHSSILRTPDSSLLIGAPSTIVTDYDEVR